MEREMEYQWDLFAKQKFKEIESYLERMDGIQVNEILSSYTGYSHDKFVATFLDLVFEKIRGPKRFFGMEIRIDSTLPKGELRMINNGVEVGRITNLE